MLDRLFQQRQIRRESTFCRDRLARLYRIGPIHLFQHYYKEYINEALAPWAIALSTGLLLSACGTDGNGGSVQTPTQDTQMAFSSDLRQDRTAPQVSSKPTLSDVRLFRIYSKEGTVEVASLAGNSIGEVIEKKSDSSSFRNGELVVLRLSRTKGKLLGNLGSGDLQVMEEKESTIFIERTLLGNEHILIIYDEWDDEEQGFPFTYVRNLEDRIFSFQRIRSTYKGIAKLDQVL